MAYDRVGMEAVCRESQLRASRADDTTGTVVKVARKYCTVEFAGSYGSQLIQYEKDTGYEKAGGYTVLRYSRIATAEEWAEIDRSRDLKEALRKVGVIIEPRAGATLAQLETVARLFNVEEG